MVFTLDSTEGRFARVVAPNGDVFTAFVSDLPPGARAGSCLKKENGRFILDPETEKKRRSEMFALQQKLRNK